MKYKLTSNTKIHNGITLYQIQAVKTFSNVKEGDLGGWIEKVSNLSQENNCWIYDDALVYGDARVYDNAQVYGNAQVYDYAQVYDNTRVYDNAQVDGIAWVYGDARVYGNARVCDKARVFGNARVSNFKHCITISNLKYDLTIVPEYVFGGCRIFTHKEFENLSLDKCEDITWTQKQLDGYKLALTIWESNQ